VWSRRTVQWFSLATRQTALEMLILIAVQHVTRVPFAGARAISMLYDDVIGNVLQFVCICA